MAANVSNGVNRWHQLGIFIEAFSCWTSAVPSEILLGKRVLGPVPIPTSCWQQRAFPLPAFYKFKLVVTADGLVLYKVNGHMKMTNKDKSGSLAVCTSTGTCQEGSYAYKDAKVKPAVGKEAYILLKTEEKVNGVQEVRRLRVKQISNASKFEHTAEVVTIQFLCLPWI